MVSLIRLRRSELIGLTPLLEKPALMEITGSFDGEPVFINNELHTANGFRKIHLEIAHIGNGLQILHCVFYPEPVFDLPIFGTDIVSRPGGISAAIVDLSPVIGNLTAPFLNDLSKLTIPNFQSVRPLPKWGSIFSPYVQFIRPTDAHEEKCFLGLVNAYLTVLITNLKLERSDPLDSEIAVKRAKGQSFYCNQQKLNDKTRNVLAKAFNPQWADAYINDFLFESPWNF